MSSYDRDMDAFQHSMDENKYEYYCKDCGHFSYVFRKDGCEFCKSLNLWVFFTRKAKKPCQWDELVLYDFGRQIRERYEKDLSKKLEWDTL